MKFLMIMSMAVWVGLSVGCRHQETGESEVNARFDNTPLPKTIVRQLPEEIEDMQRLCQEADKNAGISCIDNPNPYYAPGGPSNGLIYGEVEYVWNAHSRPYLIPSKVGCWAYYRCNVHNK